MKTILLIFISIAGALCLYSQPTDYIGYWPLDGNANDASSNSLHGSVNGAATSTGYDGTPGTSMYFDGIDDYIVVPYSSLLQPEEGSFSVSFWMKPGTNSGVRLIDERGTGSGGSYEGFHLKINTSGSDWYIYDAGIDDGSGNYKYCASCGGSYTCNEWHHVVMVYEADVELRFYIDGDLDGTVSVGSYGSLENALPLGFGAALATYGSYYPPYTVSQYYKGNLDNIYMFTRAVSDTEVDWLAGKISIGFTYDDAGNRLDRTIEIDNSAAKSAKVYQQPVLEDTTLIAQINIYPNPTEGEVFLKIEQSEEVQKASVNVYSSSGKIIFSRKIYDVEERIDLSDQIPGLYLLVVTVNDQQQTWRIIKK